MRFCSDCEVTYNGRMENFPSFVLKFRPTSTCSLYTSSCCCYYYYCNAQKYIACMVLFSYFVWLGVRLFISVPISQAEIKCFVRLCIAGADDLARTRPHNKSCNVRRYVQTRLRFPRQHGVSLGPEHRASVRAVQSTVLA